MTTNFLRLNAIGRYQIGDYELRCGSAFEIEINGTWVSTCMEADSNGEYYAVGLKGITLAGKRARIKR